MVTTFSQMLNCNIKVAVLQQQSVSPFFKLLLVFLLVQLRPLIQQTKDKMHTIRGKVNQVAISIISIPSCSRAQTRLIQLSTKLNSSSEKPNALLIFRSKHSSSISKAPSA